MVGGAFVGPRLEDLKGATLLVGSALSGHKANGLPSGTIVSEKIFERLLAIAGLDYNRFWRWARTTPFEQLLNDHPEPQRLEEVIRRNYSVQVANVFQNKLAMLASNGHVGAIVTTNYDCCLEIALERAKVSARVVVEPNEPVGPGEIPVFKIHGSVERVDHPLVLSLRQEGAMLDQKASLFRRLCDGRAVYVLGYSGRDFDICPVLLSSGYASLYWLERPTSSGMVDPFALSANLRFAIEHPQEVPGFSLVLGEFQDVLNIRADYIPAQNADAVVDEIFAGQASDPNAYALWAAALLQAISCRTAAEEVLRRFRPANLKEEAQALHLRSDLEERRGAYRTSERTLREVVRQQKKLRDWDEAVRANVQRAWRMFTGAYPLAFAYAYLRAAFHVEWLKLARPAGADVALANARIAYLRVLAWSMMQFVPKAGTVLKSPWVRRRISSKASPALDTFHQKGLWQEYHLLSNQLTKLGVRDGVFVSGKVVPASFGFWQLGNLVGDAAAFRQGPASNPGRAQLLLDGLREYGLYPEYWKFFWEFRGLIAPIPGNSHTAQKALDAYDRCELSVLGHLLNRRRRRTLKREANVHHQGSAETGNP
jgi:hypothetical protein